MKFFRIIYPFLFLLSSFLLSGCIATTNQYVDLKDEIYQLQLKLNEVQKNQADLSSKMDTLNSSMDALTSKLDETTNSMSVLGQRLDDVESNLSRKMNKLSEPVYHQPVKVSTSAAAAPAPPAPVISDNSSGPVPSKLYQLAYSDFSKGKYELAIEGFVSYLSENPKGELADQAEYYLGESNYALGKWDEALSEFGAVETDFPKSELIPASRLKKALCFEQKSKIKEMKELLGSIIKDFPNSPESFTAKEKLYTYRNNNDK
ncbi:MAG: tetratricopeptide repeat protein [Elusimicrobia bacterium]|nr:tetratricopeptide repeat protein [Candidatus Liberimonas magnetica]